MGSNPTLSAIFSPSSKCATSLFIQTEHFFQGIAPSPRGKNVPMCSVLSSYFTTLYSGEMRRQ